MEQKNKYDLYNLVKKTVRLEDVIRSYGFSLIRTSGNDYKTYCPFHNDTNASLSIKTDKQFFKCFSCGASGTAIEFIMEMERKNNSGFSFEDAILKLKNDFGLPVELEEYEKKLYENKYSSINGRYSDRKISVIEMYENLNRNFQIYLMNSSIGKKYLDYLIGRGLDIDTITHFEIGFCPKGSLQKYYKNINDINKKAAMIECGLIDDFTRNYTKITREFFYDRITFPLKDSHGNIVGYTARTLDPRDYAKYKNSKESSVFDKSEILYNFDQAQSYARKSGKIIIVEGNMDVISTYALGLKNVIGLNGCRLSDTHIRLLKSLDVDVILALDNDRAGHESTIKTAELLEAGGIRTTCIDIDDFGNYKDNGDILQASTEHPEIRESFANNFMSIEKSIFEFRLKYDYFYEKVVTPASIKEVYSSIEHDIDSEKLVYFKKYCSSRSRYTEEDIQNIIDARSIKDNLYAQLGLSIINPFLKDKQLTDDQKELVVARILNNLDNNLIMKDNSIIMNVDNINGIIDSIRICSIEREKALALKGEILAREKNMDIFTLEGIRNIHRSMYHEDKNGGKIRTAEIEGFCRSENIITEFNRICSRFLSIDYTRVSFDERINELCRYFYSMINLRMFEGSFGRIERLFIEEASKKMNIRIDFSLSSSSEYKKTIKKSIDKNNPVYLKDYFSKICYDLDRTKRNKIPEKVTREF